MKVRWTVPAEEQLEQAYRYIAEGNLDAAERITSHIVDVTEMLGKHPEAGRRGRVANTREFAVSRHAVYCRVQRQQGSRLDSGGVSCRAKVAGRILMGREGGQGQRPPETAAHPASVRQSTRRSDSRLKKK
jgi:plasmid stabilization system protein ParE